jgi:hypothetical protein
LWRGEIVDKPFVRSTILMNDSFPDIGLTRDLSEFNILGGHKSYRALAELDDTTLSFERTRTSGAARSQASRSRS